MILISREKIGISRQMSIPQQRNNDSVKCQRRINCRDRDPFYIVTCSGIEITIYFCIFQVLWLMIVILLIRYTQQWFWDPYWIDFCMFLHRQFLAAQRRWDRDLFTCSIGNRDSGEAQRWDCNLWTQVLCPCGNHGCTSSGIFFVTLAVFG